MDISMDTAAASPPSPLSPKSTTAMHIDLSGLPPLVTPAPPSNTLLITNLTNPLTFSAPTLREIRAALSTPVPLFSFSPLKTLRRIIVSYPTIDAAIDVRKALDGTEILGARTRIYFGEPTKVDESVVHLEAPEQSKMFFISPPPSPPEGWTMRNEDPPNMKVHADDLASALAGLRATRPGPRGDLMGEDDDDAMETVEGEGATTYGEDANGRRSSTTLVYDGGKEGLPAVTVEDTTGDEEDEDEEWVGGEKKIMAHTTRPPVELMET